MAAKARAMPNYRRAFVGGTSWFFRFNLLDRRRRLLVEHTDALRQAVRETRRRLPFEIDDMVMLPDHLHAVWTLPEGDCDFPVRWRFIKMLTTTRRVRGERPGSAATGST
jgi:putative transposase